MKKLLIAFLLVFVMIIAMPITAFGGPNGGPPPTPPPFERSSIFIPRTMVAFDCPDEILDQ